MRPSVPPPSRTGLATAEAHRLLAEVGPNEIVEKRHHPIQRFLRKLWAPIPWMLEISLLLEIVLGHEDQAIIVGGLLLFNAVLSFLQEARAGNAIRLLQARLVVQARVLRDGRWSLLPARELVPGDVVHLRTGDVTPADCTVLDGQLLEDRSILTGESMPTEVRAEGRVYAASTLKRGEATATVRRTGPRCHYGKTAQLVETAQAASHIEQTVLKIARNLMVLDAFVAAAILVKASVTGLPLVDVLPFLLMLLVASVPVALPATFTLASALGSRSLAENGVLVARLSALEEAAAMDVLCCDKTGTVTLNRISVTEVRPFPGHTEAEVLQRAADASDPSTQDPIDLAVFEAARARGAAASVRKLSFSPFDSATKRTEARVELEGRELHVAKGAPEAVASLAVERPPAMEQAVAEIASRGERVLAVAAGAPGGLRLMGLLGLSDRPRPDSKRNIELLEGLGIRPLLISGDGLPTARAVAEAVSIRGAAWAADELRKAEYQVSGVGVVAEVFPEDKFRVVKGLQRGRHVVGMTGDGVNDAPALKQADVGIAVSGATDVAKAAAGIVLIEEGLSRIPVAVGVSRQIYQRLVTYTLNKIVKTVQVVLFLGGWLLFGGGFVLNPRLIVLLLFANDFVTMSLATDRVKASPRPERWNVVALFASSLLLALLWLAFSVAAVLVGQSRLQLGTPGSQTLAFLTLVFTGQATVYLARSRERFWGSAPSRSLALSSVAALASTALLAVRGWWMAPLAPAIVGGLAVAVLLCAIVIDTLKLQLFRLLRPHVAPAVAAE